MNFLAEFLVFDPPNHFVVVRLIEFCASLVDFFHGNTITVFHTAVFQDIKGTGVNGTIERPGFGRLSLCGLSASIILQIRPALHPLLLLLPPNGLHRKSGWDSTVEIVLYRLHQSFHSFSRWTKFMFRLWVFIFEYDSNCFRVLLISNSTVAPLMICS